MLFLSADYGGHGNSFHGSGGRGNKRAQMRYCLRLIRGMVSVGDDGLNQDLVDQGAINQIVGKFCNRPLLDWNQLATEAYSGSLKCK